MKSGNVVCGGLSFEEAPVETRERVAFLDTDLAVATRALRDELHLPEAVLLSTCNRVEYFAFSDEPERIRNDWPRFLREYHGLDDSVEVPAFQHDGAECVDHLFQLTSGLKSMVLGETEILGQVKAAYQIAVEAGTTGKLTNRLFQSSFAAAKAVRTQTAITRGSVSVGSVSVDLAEKIFGDLRGRSAMVVGAGDTSEKTARTLRSKGVHSVIVANRTFERAAELARQLEGRAVHWDRWEDEALDVDIIISSTSAPHYVLTYDRVSELMEHRQQRPLFLIDLAVPRDLEPAINALDDVYLYDIDDLQSIANRNMDERRAEVERGERILKPHVAKYLEWVEALAVREADSTGNRQQGVS